MWSALKSQTGCPEVWPESLVVYGQLGRRDALNSPQKRAAHYLCYVLLGEQVTFDRGSDDNFSGKRKASFWANPPTWVCL